MAVRVRLGLERERLRPWSRLRTLLWWLWPAFPTSWSQVPARLRPGAAQIGRLTAAAVVAYLVANAIYPGILDLTAPLTALLVVQASTVGTLRMGLVRVGAVLTGVLVAVVLASSVGLSWWSLALVIASSLVLAKVLRLGDQTLEAPISAMLILAVSSRDLAAEVRVANTLIGTAVGIAFSLLVPVAIPNARARESVRGVARSQAGLLDEVAMSLSGRAPHPDEVQAWLDWVEHIRTDLVVSADAVDTVERSRKLNPVALAVPTVHPGLQDAVGRLDRCLSAVRAMLSVVALRTAPSGTDPEDELVAAELRRAFAVVLDDLATGLRAFADVIDAEYGPGSVGAVDEAMSRLVEIIREARAVVTELMLIDVDPRERTDLWMLQGSVLAAVDHVLSQLDLGRAARRSEAWMTRLAGARWRAPSS